MRRLLSLIVIVLALLAFKASGADLEDLRASVLPLKGATRSASWNCSAVVIKPGQALTAAHCVDVPDAEFLIDGRPATVVRKNRLLDIALITFRPKGEVPLVLATKMPKMGHGVSVVGFALGKPDLYTQVGHVANAQNVDKEFVLDVAAFRGDSGGAVINKDFQLVGIITSGEPDGAQEQIFAVPLSVIADFLLE